MVRINRAVLFGACLLVALYATGCGRLATRDLQSQVDRANRQMLTTANTRTYTMMFWNDKPQEWLMIRDVYTVNEMIVQYGATIAFNAGRLDRNTRRSILDDSDVMPPSQSSLQSAASIGQKRSSYDKAAQQVRDGKKWSGSSFTTTIHPAAVPFKEMGTISWNGRQVRLLGGDVETLKEKDAFALYPLVRTLVGLDVQSGDLVFEYIANLEPWKRVGFANRMLAVFDQSDRMLLHSEFKEYGPDERSNQYLTLRSDLMKLEELLRKAAEQQPT